jgi:hypothetical protein
MSGGSYDYFYSRAPEKLRSYAADLTSMADRCQQRAEDGPDRDWNGDLIDLAALAEAGDFLRALSFRMAGMARVLEIFDSVTHNVEWWASGDTGADSVEKAWKKAVRAMPNKSVSEED